MTKFFLFIAAALAPSAASAQSQVALVSDVFVEKLAKDSAGRGKLILEQPTSVAPGDRLVFVVKYQNKGRAPAPNFVVTNPLPNSVVFQSTLDNGALVSVDGGRNWGALNALRVKDRDGALRNANATDVTHIRWAFAKPIPAGSAGKLMFRGIVR